MPMLPSPTTRVRLRVVITGNGIVCFRHGDHAEDLSVSVVRYARRGCREVLHVRVSELAHRRDVALQRSGPGRASSEARNRDDGGVRIGRPEIYGVERRTGFQVHRSNLAADFL